MIGDNNKPVTKNNNKIVIEYNNNNDDNSNVSKNDNGSDNDDNDKITVEEINNCFKMIDETKSFEEQINLLKGIDLNDHWHIKCYVKNCKFFRRP